MGKEGLADAGFWRAAPGKTQPRQHKREKAAAARVDHAPARSKSQCKIVRYSAGGRAGGGTQRALGLRDVLQTVECKWLFAKRPVPSRHPMTPICNNARNKQTIPE